MRLYLSSDVRVGEGVADRRCDRVSEGVFHAVWAVLPGGHLGNVDRLMMGRIALLTSLRTRLKGQNGNTYSVGRLVRLDVHVRLMMLKFLLLREHVAIGLLVLELLLGHLPVLVLDHLSFVVHDLADLLFLFAFELADVILGFDLSAQKLAVVFFGDCGVLPIALHHHIDLRPSQLPLLLLMRLQIDLFLLLRNHILVEVAIEYLGLLLLSLVKSHLEALELDVLTADVLADSVELVDLKN